MDHNSPKKEGKRAKTKQIRVPDIEEFLAEAESETSVTESPCLGEVGSELVQEVAAVAALEKEEDEE